MLPLNTKIVNFTNDNEEYSYHDCVENSLLRLLQMMFSMNDQIDIDLMRQYIKIENIINFFENNNIIAPSIYYDLEVGLQLRNSWAQLLGKINNIVYNRNNKYEMRACISNIINILSFLFDIKQIEDVPKFIFEFANKYKLCEFINFHTLCEYREKSFLYVQTHCITLNIKNHIVLIKINEHFDNKFERNYGHMYLIIDDNYPRK